MIAVPVTHGGSHAISIDTKQEKQDFLSFLNSDEEIYKINDNYYKKNTSNLQVYDNPDCKGRSYDMEISFIKKELKK